MIASLFHFPSELKTDAILFYLSKIGFWIGAFLSPLQHLMLAMCGLILIDHITGVRASIKRGERHESRKALRTPFKLLLYNLMILSGALAEILIPIPLIRVMAGFIAAAELKSIVENFEAVSGIKLYQYVKESINRYTTRSNPK